MSITDAMMDDFWADDDEVSSGFNEAAESFAAKLANVDGLKTFPVVAQEIISLVSKKDFEIREVTAALERDPSLATGVLRVANSAFFGGSRPVSNIDKALVRLGSRSVLEVVAAVATMDLFPDSGGVGKEVRDHCAATAAIVQYLAKEFGDNKTDGIFLCGLLHDVGKMLLIESREIDYVVDGIDALKWDSVSKEEKSLLGFDHAVLGECVLGYWKLPAPIPKVVGMHHRSVLGLNDSPLRIFVAFLRLADHLDAFARDIGPNTEEKIARAGRSDEAAAVGVTSENLLEHWPNILEAREEALRMFSK